MVFRDFSEVFRGPLRDPLRGRFPSQRLSVLVAWFARIDSHDSRESPANRKFEWFGRIGLTRYKNWVWIANDQFARIALWIARATKLSVLLPLIVLPLELSPKFPNEGHLVVEAKVILGIAAAIGMLIHLMAMALTILFPSSCNDSVLDDWNPRSGRWLIGSVVETDFAGKWGIHQHRGAPPLLVCRPTLRPQSKKSNGVYHVLGKTREKGIPHHRSRKGIHHRGPRISEEKCYPLSFKGGQDIQRMMTLTRKSTFSERSIF